MSNYLKAKIVKRLYICECNKLKQVVTYIRKLDNKAIKELEEQIQVCQCSKIMNIVFMKCEL